MTEKLPGSDGGRWRSGAGKLGSLVGRVRTYFADQQRQIAIEYSISEDRLDEMRRRVWRVTGACRSGLSYYLFEEDGDMKWVQIIYFEDFECPVCP